MRLKLSKTHNFFTYRACNWHILWVHRSGTVYSTSETYIHPLSTAYKDICRYSGLRLCKTDSNSQKIALILVASLVLL